MAKLKTGQARTHQKRIDGIQTGVEKTRYQPCKRSVGWGREFPAVDFSGDRLASGDTCVVCQQSPSTHPNTHCLKGMDAHGNGWAMCWAVEAWWGQRGIDYFVNNTEMGAEGTALFWDDESKFTAPHDWADVFCSELKKSSVSDDEQVPSEDVEETGGYAVTDAPRFEKWDEIYPQNSWGDRFISYMVSKGFRHDFATVVSVFPVAVRMGNLFYIENNVGKVNPNLYLLPVGSSSSKKDVTINAVIDVIPDFTVLDTVESVVTSRKNACLETRLVERTVSLYAGSDPTGAGLFGGLARMYGMGFCDFSEYSDFLRTNRESPNNPESLYKKHFGHKNTAKPAHKQYLDTEPVKNPVPSRIACSQWERIKHDIDNDSKLDGSVSRNIFVVLPDIDPDETVDFEDFKNFDCRASNLKADLENMFKFTNSMERTLHPDWKSYTTVIGTPVGFRQAMTITPEAQTLYNKWIVATKHRLKKEYCDAVYSFCGKVYGEQPLKIALALAFARQTPQDTYSRPAIDSDTMKASLTICDHVVDFLIFVYEASAGLPWDEAFILDKLAEIGEPISYRDLNHKCRKMREIGKPRFIEIVRKYDGYQIIIIKEGRKITYASVA